MVESMTGNDLLVVIITALVSGVAGNLFSGSVTKGLLKLVTTHARHIEHIAATGAQLFEYGVPLDEAQFRDAYRAYQAVQDRLGPAAERNEWQAAEGVAAVRKFSILAGTACFPMLGEEDSAWTWYSENNAYATREFPERHGWKLQPPGTVEI
jgi:hypothetical protein